ncbi:MAG: FAD:protein FMN transferase [Candidatus Dormibacteria bacterium]
MRLADAEPTGRDSPVPAPGCLGIELDRANLSVCLPEGVQLDPGGIGKGFAADLVALELIASGCERVCVNVGGDVRVAGAADPAGWIVAIEDPRLRGAEIARVALQAGAVASTSRRARVWRLDGVEHHHLIDPATGQQGDGAYIGVSVIAGECWWADALCKAVYLAGEAEAATVLVAGGAVGIMVRPDGRVHGSPGIAEFLR